MTREEAIKLLEKAITVEAAVGAYVALGMLKLDEPKNSREKFVTAINGRVIGHSGGGYMQQYVVGPSDALILLQYVEAAGLTIVEK